jgi:hypothetical protein
MCVHKKCMHICHSHTPTPLHPAQKADLSLVATQHLFLHAYMHTVWSMCEHKSTVVHAYICVLSDRVATQWLNPQACHKTHGTHTKKDPCMNIVRQVGFFAFKACFIHAWLTALLRCMLCRAETAWTESCRELKTAPMMMMMYRRKTMY